MGGITGRCQQTEIFSKELIPLVVPHKEKFEGGREQEIDSKSRFLSLSFWTIMTSKRDDDDAHTGSTSSLHQVMVGRMGMFVLLLFPI